MNCIRKTIRFIGKIIASVAAIVILAIAATGFSAIYKFRAAQPLTGADIYNPYSSLDTAYCWKRANFHTHTKVDGLLNECTYTPAQTQKALESFGYDIVTFSNHNRLTKHPFDSTLQVNVYEHGYNLFKYHKLVFGCRKVHRYDNLIPLLASQKQFQIDYLGNSCDIVQLNHPLRTEGLSRSQLEKLSGYMLIEVDSGRSTENEYWDWALSAGHYSFGVANDDLHYPDRSNRIAVRCNFLCTPSARYEDIRQTLMNGCFYSMRVPDYGHGDWEVKKEANRHLPFIKNIGIKDDTIFISLSEAADSIKVTGQGHTILHRLESSDSLSYKMKADDSYARITAWFQDGEVIYTNPFARYDSTLQESPYDGSRQQIDILLTIIYNLLLLSLCIIAIYTIYLIIRKWK